MVLRDGASRALPSPGPARGPARDHAAAAGYRDATLAAAVVAPGLAILAVRAVPSVRPAAAAKVAVH